MIALGSMYRCLDPGVTGTVWLTNNRDIEYDDIGILTEDDIVVIITIATCYADSRHTPMAFIVASSGLIGWVNFNPNKWLQL